MDNLTRYRVLLDQLQVLRRSSPEEETPAEAYVLDEMGHLWPFLRRREAVEAWTREHQDVEARQAGRRAA